MINLTKMGGLGPMHPYDKARDHARAYGTSLHADEDPEDGGTLYDIGIEYKGMERRNDPTATGACRARTRLSFESGSRRTRSGTTATAGSSRRSSRTTCCSCEG